MDINSFDDIIDNRHRLLTITGQLAMNYFMQPQTSLKADEFLMAAMVRAIDDTLDDNNKLMSLDAEAQEALVEMTQKLPQIVKHFEER